MTAPVNRQVVLAARPVGMPTAADFKIETAPVPEPGAPGISNSPMSWSSVSAITRQTSTMSAAAPCIVAASGCAPPIPPRPAVRTKRPLSVPAKCFRATEPRVS